MTAPTPSRSLHFYDALLRLYPARVWREDGAAMRQLFGDLLRDAQREARPANALTILWLRVLADTGRNVAVEYADEGRRLLKRWACRLGLEKSVLPWPAVLLATVVTLVGLVAKIWVMRTTGSAALGVVSIVLAGLVAALILERTLRAGHHLLVASGVVLASMFVPLAWAPNVGAWLQFNPWNLYTVVWLGASWRPYSQSRRHTWGLTGTIVAVNLFSALLIGV
jgi:hypothetical protein